MKIYIVTRLPWMSGSLIGVYIVLRTPVYFDRMETPSKELWPLGCVFNQSYLFKQIVCQISKLFHCVKGKVKFWFKVFWNFSIFTISAPNPPLIPHYQSIPGVWVSQTRKYVLLRFWLATIDFSRATRSICIIDIEVIGNNFSNLRWF